MKSSEETSSPLLWLLQYVKPYSIALLGTFLSLSLAAGAILFLGQGLRALIDHGFSGSNPAFLDQALMMLLGLVLILALASFARAYLSSWLGERVATDIRIKAFEHLLFQPSQFYQNNSTGSLQSHLHTDTALLQVLLGGSASTGVRSIIQFIGAIILLFYSNLKLAALSCLIIPILVLPIVLFGRRVRQEALTAQNAVAEAAGFSNECLSSVQTIKAFNQQRSVSEKFSDLMKGSLALTHNRILAQSYLSTTVIFLVFAAVSLLLWYGGYEVFSKRITSGELLSFIFYAIIAAGSINSLSTVYGDWQRAMAACSRLKTMIESYAFHDDEKNKKLIYETPERIIFENIEFRYPGISERTAIKSFNLNIKRGETIAIVGSSGAGKTTIFNLLLGFYKPDNGRILIDDKDIQDININDLRNKIGWVPQDPAIFIDTVYNNIRFSRPDASNEEIEHAAHLAYATDFINKLPHGFETQLGKEGVALSSGQKQRIAIARAILRNPSILLLDEAMNSLDAESEFQVQKALDQLMRDRTTLFVTHRLSSVLKATRIVVMDHGGIISSGSHTSLMRTCPIYRRFVSLQFDQQEDVA